MWGVMQLAFMRVWGCPKGMGESQGGSSGWPGDVLPKARNVVVEYGKVWLAYARVATPGALGRFFLWGPKWAMAALNLSARAI